MKTIAIIGTLDTKGEEVKYIRDKLIKKGKKVIVIDVGIRGEPIGITQPDITREEIARAAGSTIEKLQKMLRGPAIEIMMKGVEKIVKKAYDDGRIDGIIAVGGAEGSLLAAAGMKTLPIGIPKFLISSAASGNQTFGPYVGTKDVIVMHSVVDILGINEVSKKIFDNAIAAINGMVDENVGIDIKSKNLIGATMYGNTTPLVMKAKKILEKEGYEVVVFNPYPTGGKNFEELIQQNYFVGLLDVTLQNITADLLGGVAHPPGEAKNRLEAGAKAGIPQVIVPGCVDMIEFGEPSSVPRKYKKRKMYQHNPFVTVVRTSKEEMKKLGKVISKKLNKSVGPTVLLFPLRGLSMYNKKGLPLYDPEADAELLKSLKNNLDPKIKLIEVDAHINDDEFAEKCASTLIDLLRKR
jgi:uncharacterized protein (UPF0261 family)